MKISYKIGFFLIFGLFVAFFPHPALATGYPKAVVFVQGLGTGLSLWGGEKTFDTIKARLLSQGFVKDQFLEFSYKGGSVDSLGLWSPNPYSCGATGKGLTTSTNTLISLISQYSAKNPGTKIVVLGHSVGGLLGVRSLQGVVDGRIGQGVVESVITLDSPLRGVPWQNINLYEKFLGCPLLVDSQVGNDMLSLYTNLLSTDDFNTNMVQSGVPIYTMGNNQDCIYDTTQCRIAGKDWTASQIIQSATTTLYDLGNDPKHLDVGHKRILDNPLTVSDIVTLIY